MVDADGATDINDLTNLMKNMDDVLQSTSRAATDSVDIFAAAAPHAIVIGSRAHLQEDATASRTFVRTLLMKAFHMFVAILCSRTVRDTQCGFKLFTRAAAITLFSNLHLQRWAFDIEIITIAEQMKVPLVEVGVNWEEVDVKARYVENGPFACQCWYASRYAMREAVLYTWNMEATIYDHKS